MDFIFDETLISDAAIDAALTNPDFRFDLYAGHAAHRIAKGMNADTAAAALHIAALTGSR